MLLLDAKQRRYLVTLAEGGEFHSHAGFVPHADIVGQPEGAVVRSTKGAEYTVLRPTLEDFVVEMPRGAQVIYPKDLAPICMLADIGPGMRVFETGVGSGALSMTMLRWGADDRRLRAPRGLRQPGPHQRRASFLGEDALDRYDVELARQLRGHRRARPVRPGRARPARAVAGRAARRAACCAPAASSSPTRRRSPRRRRPARRSKGKWIDARTLEVLHRGWHIDGQAVRPDHRMVAHTGFLTVARFLGQSDDA